ncbi:MAG: hypothetical protein JW950_13430 [Deltaproteobacteria bacterium]|nr:hypothetical protein [Deltaproteobacteria bacterium]
MVKAKHRVLLAIDAFVNLLLGVLLLSFPAGLPELLGLPPTDTYFYATILGGVIFGIGIALCMELWGARQGVRGLGLGGAIAINVCGAGVLLIWLLLGGLDLPLRGQIILWGVAVVVLGIGIAEIAARSWKCQE